MTNALQTRAISRNSRPMDLDMIRRYAPSAFAETAHARTSERYNHFSTERLINALATQGWEPIQAIESSTRLAGKAGHAKHLIRFDNFAIQSEKTTDRINLLIKNGSYGDTGYSLTAGVFRLICSNGLIISDNLFEPSRFTHVQANEEQIIEAQFRVIEQIPLITERVDTYKAITMTPRESEIFAEAARELRWDSEAGEVAPIHPRELLQRRRTADRQDDLYTTFNVVQENLIQGGLRGKTASNKRTTTRAVTGVDGNMKLNKALWLLTEEMAKLKA